jgi:branched-chain amino acid transport system ATP-binding protein
MGFVPPSSGTIRMGDRDISRTPPEVLARAGIAYIPQEEAIFQDLSVEDNLRLALARDRDLEPGLRRIADYFPVIAERRKQKAGTLSGGEQKMLLMARALIVQPKVILVDEISEGLQPTMIAKMADALVRMAAENDTSILLVEQNVGFVAKVAHEVALLKIGQIVDRRSAAASDGLDEADLIEMMRV